MGINVLPKILIADDEPDLLERAEELLRGSYQVKTALTVPLAKSILMQNDIDVLIADLNFEGQQEDGISLLNFINEKYLDVEVVVLSADLKTERVVAAMRRNLVDFIPKKGRYADVLTTAVARAFEKKRLKSKKQSEFVFLTNSPVMKPLLKRVRQIVDSPGTFSILVTGETGTGKDILVSYIANLLGKKLVIQNMSAIPENMVESELFGHLKGSFTGAIANKMGLIEQAHNGIFCLDEFGESSYSTQTKLLRAIQTGEITPVGATVSKHLNVRYIGTTNCDLQAMIKEKTFREDLYQRMSTFVLHIPPLRERPEDIILYANHFINKHAGGRKLTLTQGGIDALMSNHWVGNVRQLENVIESAIVIAENGVIDEVVVSEQLKKTSSEDEVLDENTTSHPPRSKIMTVLTEEEGNRTKTAARFKVHPSTLLRWMKKYGISDLIKAQPGRPSLMKPVRLVKAEEPV